MSEPTPDAAVPAEESPEATCGYCGRPFRSEHARDLHVGKRHAEACTDRERAAHERAEGDEREALFYLQIKALVLFALLWMTTIFGYMIAGGLRWNT